MLIIFTLAHCASALNVPLLKAHEGLQMCVCGNSSSCSHHGISKKSYFVVTVGTKWQAPAELWICVSEFVGLVVSDAARCFQKWWAFGSPCGNAPNDPHSETPDHGSAPGHTETQTICLNKDHNDCACVFKIQQHIFTCPCGSTSSRCRTLTPSIPLSTYWPEAELLSLTRKSPLQVRSDSACLLPNLKWKTQNTSYWERKGVTHW